VVADGQRRDTLPNEGPALSGRIDHDDDAAKPGLRPANPNFSSGPCSKRPGWSLEALLRRGRSAVRTAPRSARPSSKQAIDLTREILEVPADYRIGIVPASDTGAVEMALWSLLGERGVDMVAWESFGAGWVTDVVKQLKLEGRPQDRSRLRRAAGPLQGRFRPRRGLHLERHHVRRARSQRRFHPGDRKGLTICDATSAAFAQNLDFAKTRCRHLLLAEGSRRRGRARHAHPVARAPSSG
jgi:phosphoserine aminotransferase